MYNKNFTINKNFQSSVNLELDIGNEDKIYEYVPTNDICDVLKRYLKSVLGIKRERATTLVGPYGKGKSFLLLILSYILSDKKDSKCWNDLANKIKKVDPELFDLMMELKNKNYSLLTVIINSNYDNLEQSFMLALNEALTKEGLENLIPKSAYTVALETLKSWSHNSDISKEVKNICLEKYSYSIEDIVEGLKNYSEEQYDKFCNVYYCVTRGVKFNPFISDDLVKFYSDVSLQLSDSKYSGILVIFDEFSKFIESTSSDLAKGLKIVQDFAEKCNRTGKNGQLHLCCITHKTISLYGNLKSDSFKAVEGRFAEIRFNRSIEGNYQIISSAILRTKDASDIANAYISRNSNFYERIEKLGIFENNRKIFNDLFPLNPLASYSLIQLSELVAQNERTLYTFLSDTDINSFNYFLHNNDLKDGLLNVDKVFDYFSDLLQKEESGFIRNVWYRAESIAFKVENSLEKRIIKALAIILMINDFDKIAPNEESLSLCLDEPIEEIQSIVKALVGSHYFRKNILNNFLSFSLSSSKQIEERIETVSKTKFKSLDESSICNSLCENKFIIPHRHNEERKITRFFKTIFISEKEFISLSDFDIYFENNYCDGVCLNLIRKTLNAAEIEKRVNDVSNERVIVCYPNIKIDNKFQETLSRYACLNDIKSEMSLDDTSKQEIELLLEEAQEDVRFLMTKYFNETSLYLNFKYKEKSVSALLSEILDDYYSIPLIFNNELVNKRNVSSQYQKAVNNVVDNLLNENNLSFKTTSPEASIQRSIFERNSLNEDFRNLIDRIKATLLSLEGKKESFDSLFSFLEDKPYGIRRGVLPLLVGKAISELSADRNNILIYYEKKEIPLTSENITKGLGKDNYYISFARGSKEQKVYLDALLKIFNVKSSNFLRTDILNISNCIRKYFMGLPSIIRSCRKNDYLNIGENVLELKNSFLDININPYESIFTLPFIKLKTQDYKDVLRIFTNLQSFFESKIKMYKQDIINSVKNIFNIECQTSLKMGLNFVSNSIIDGNKRLILSDLNKKIVDLIKCTINFDDIQAINDLSKCITDKYIEDWESDNRPKVLNAFSDLFENIQNGAKISVSISNIDDLFEDGNELEGISMLLSNNIESVIDEFSDSLSNAEKVKVLSKLMKKYL